MLLHLTSRIRSLGPTGQEAPDFLKLSSDLHMCAVVCACPHLPHANMYIYTYTSQMHVIKQKKKSVDVVWDGIRATREKKMEKKI